MSVIFERLLKHSEDFKRILESRAFKSVEQHDYEWENNIYISSSVRRAHLDVVDVRDTKKLYMMHLCIFPKTWDSSPIFGFDLIAGPNKVTGAFFDFSPVVKDHPLTNWYVDQVKDLEWSKPRQLPEWARNIFSPNMIAAGNINTEQELNLILDLSKRSLEYYLNYLHTSTMNGPAYEEKINGPSYLKEQNWYCQNQKLNPHTPRVMESLGYSPEVVKKFIQECLFPEV